MPTQFDINLLDRVLRMLYEHPSYTRVSPEARATVSQMQSYRDELAIAIAESGQEVEAAL